MMPCSARPRGSSPGAPAPVGLAPRLLGQVRAPRSAGAASASSRSSSSSPSSCWMERSCSRRIVLALRLRHPSWVSVVIAGPARARDARAAGARPAAAAWRRRLELRICWRVSRSSGASRRRRRRRPPAGLRRSPRRRRRPAGMPSSGASRRRSSSTGRAAGPPPPRRHASRPGPARPVPRDRGPRRRRRGSAPARRPGSAIRRLPSGDRSSCTIVATVPTSRSPLAVRAALSSGSRG